MTRTDASPSGWWRVNRWGLIALVPALALGVGRPAWSSVHEWRALQPLDASVSQAGGWAALGSSRVRLAAVGPRMPVTSWQPRPELPVGMVVYRADLAFDLVTPKALLGCRIELETTDGRRYSADPKELATTGTRSTLCGPDDDQPAPTGRVQGQGEAWFVLPVGARPAAVRVIVPSMQPQYAVVRPPEGQPTA